jgi:hypothetical protein
MPEPADALVPRGSLALHIGVHKTGTTAVQSALAARRDELRAHGVDYPGTLMAHRTVASSAMGRPLGFRTDGARPPRRGLWEKTLKDAEAFDGTTLISSEFFAEADDDVCRRMVSDVGVDRLQVIITLRNLARILPSAWQQNLKSGFRTQYEDWLRFILIDEEGSKGTTFWRRHRHDRVVRRWAEVAGADRVTVVVVDERDRDGIYRAFETLLGLPSGLLSPSESTSANRSFSAAEAEFFRRLNLAVADAGGWARFRNVAHDGLEKSLVEGRVADPDEPRLQTPQWALDRAADLAATFVEEIRASGVRVIGDLDVLSQRLSGPEGGPIVPEEMPIDAAVAALLGVLESAAQSNQSSRRALTRARSLLRRH